MAKNTKNLKNLKQNLNKKQENEEQQPQKDEVVLKENAEEILKELVANDDPFPGRETLRISDVARYFDTTERTVRLWLQHGHLEDVRTPGGLKRITKKSFDTCRFRHKLEEN